MTADPVSTVSTRAAIALVFLGGGLGSSVRFGLAELLKRVGSGAFPWGTWIANVLGSAIIGWWMARSIGTNATADPQRLFVVVGLLGGFTTFSAFSGETLAMLQSGATARAVVYAASSVGVALVAAMAGYALTRGTVA